MPIHNQSQQKQQTIPENSGKENTENSLKNYDGPDKIITIQEKRDELRENKQVLNPIRMQSLYPGLDKWIQFFYGGELIIISGNEGEGKSLLARSFTESFIQQGKVCLWFTFEETYQQFVNKFGDDLPLFFVPKKLISNSLEWIKLKIKETRDKYDQIDAVFVDHMHYLLSQDNPMVNRDQEIGNKTREIKQLAVKENIAWFLLAHTNRSAGENELKSSNLRDSGMLGKEADKILFIWRNDNDPGMENHSTLKLEKDRESGYRKKYVHLYKPGTFLREYNDTEIYTEEKSRKDLDGE